MRDVYGLDRHALAAIAERTGAITPPQLRTRRETVPREWMAIARRHVVPGYHDAVEPHASRDRNGEHHGR
jgi:hypothetical protein